MKSTDTYLSWWSFTWRAGPDLPWRKVDDMATMDPDYISLIEIDSAILAFSYLHTGDLWYTFADEDWLTIRTLKSHNDIIDLINKSLTEKMRVLNVFVEHVVKEAEIIESADPPLPLTGSGPSQDETSIDLHS